MTAACLVYEALKLLQRPLDEDVTDRVFHTIQNNRDLRQRYDELLRTDQSLNNQIGRSVREQLGFPDVINSNNRASNDLCGHYTKLDVIGYRFESSEVVNSHIDEGFCWITIRARFSDERTESYPSATFELPVPFDPSMTVKDLSDKAKTLARQVAVEAGSRIW